MPRELLEPAIRNPHSARRLSPFRVLWLLLLLGAGVAAAAEAPVRLEVLRADAFGTVVDVLLRVEVPGAEAEELGPGDFAVFVAPADLAPAEAATPRFRVARLFLKRLGSAYYLDIRQFPAAVGSTACQLLLQVNRRGQVLAAERLPKVIEHKAGELDVALVIDESLSMTRTDPGNLRLVAAKTFVDLARRSSRISRIAIISFNDHARTRVGLTSPANTDALYAAIDKIIAFDQTDIDAALDQARAAFDASPGTGDRAVVLLTDGKNEPNPYRDTHRLFADRRWRVYTIGLSELADAAVLQRIASDTGGEYHGAPTNAELQDIFSKICLTLQKKVAIRSRDLAVKPGQPTEDPCPIDDTISALTLGLNARDADTAFLLRDPKGRTLTPELAKSERGLFYGRGASFQFFEITAPLVGDWTARIESPRAGHANLTATAATPLLLRAYPLKPSYSRGEPIEIAASLAIGDSVLADARIEARVLTADALPRVSDPREGTAAVRLYDDGTHQDTGRDDGVFAGFFPGSEAPGPCTIHLLATGTTPAGNRFEREARLSTTITADGYSKLWCSTRVLNLGVVYMGERASCPFDLRLAAPARGGAAEIVQSAIAPLALTLPRVPNPREGIPAEALALEPKPLRLEPGKLTPATLTVSVPANQPPGQYRGQIELASRYDKLALPVQLEVRAPKLVFDRPSLDLGAVESGARVEAAVAVRLDPRGTATASLAASDPLVTVAPKSLQVGSAGFSPSSTSPERPEVRTTNATARVAFAPPADHPSATLHAKVIVETPFGKSELPVTARVIRPSFAASPATLDFGEVRPGETAERQVVLRLEGLTAREVSLTTQPMVRSAAFRPYPGLPERAEARTTNMPLAASAEKLALTPGTDAPAKLTLRVPPAQPPGAYRGLLTARTPLGEQTVAVTARVAEADTFRVAALLDFGSLETGAAKERTVEVVSLVDAEQKLIVTLPHAQAGAWASHPETWPFGLGATLESAVRRIERAQPAADWRLASEPGSLVLPPLGKASVTFRLATAANAKPGPLRASVAFRGPSRAASLDVRAELTRAPHATLAFEPPLLDVGNLSLPKVSDLREGTLSRQVLVRSLAAEAQDVAIERIDSPVAVVALEAEPSTFSLPPMGSQPLALAFRPSQGVEDAEFEAVVVARGGSRSLPAALRLRGRVFTPFGATFAVSPDPVDFGEVACGQRKRVSVHVISLIAQPQRISLAAPPAAEGVDVAAGDAGFGLPPYVDREVLVEVEVASDAAPGQRRMAWEIRGPGEAVSAELRVEVVLPPEAPLLARTEESGIGWTEGAVLFLLLAALLALLVAVILLAIWLIRKKRIPAVLKYYAASAAIHAVVLGLLQFFSPTRWDGRFERTAVKSTARAIGGGRLWSGAAEVGLGGGRDRSAEAGKGDGDSLRPLPFRAEPNAASLSAAQAGLLRPTPQVKPDLAKAEHEATKKFSAEDFAVAPEPVRDPARIEPAPEPESQEAARTDPARLTQSPAASRDSLKPTIEQPAGPKAAQPARPSEPVAAPAVPDLARPSAADRLPSKADEFVPAPEEVKPDALQAAAGGQEGGREARDAALARSVRQPGTGAERSTATVERAGGAAVSPGTGAGRPGVGATRPGLRPGRAAPLTWPSEGTASATRAAAHGENLAPPDELAPTVEAPAQALGAGGGEKVGTGEGGKGGTGTASARDVGVARQGYGGKQGGLERQIGQGGGATPGEARGAGLAATGRVGAGRSGAATAANLPEIPAGGGPAALPSLGTADGLAPAVEGPKLAAAQPWAESGSGGLPAVSDVGAGRATRFGAAGRSTGSGERSAIAAERGPAAPGPAAHGLAPGLAERGFFGTGRPGGTTAFHFVGSPGVERRAAPAGFAAPGETPTVPAVPAGEPAGGPLPGQGGGTPEAAPILLGRGPGGGGAASARTPGPALAAAGLGAGDAGPLARGAGRTPAAGRPATGGGTPGSLELPAAGRPGAPVGIAAADEAPAVAVAPVPGGGGGEGIGAQPGEGGGGAAPTAVGRPGGGGGFAARAAAPAPTLAMAEGGTGPVAGPGGRPSGPAGGLPEARGSSEIETPSAAAGEPLLVEGPLVEPRRGAEAGGGGGDGSRLGALVTVVGRWGQAARGDAERGIALASATGAAAVAAPRAAAAGRAAAGGAPGADLPLPSRAETAAIGPQAAGVGADLTQEAIEIAPPVAPAGRAGDAAGQAEPRPGPVARAGGPVGAREREASPTLAPQPVEAHAPTVGTRNLHLAGDGDRGYARFVLPGSESQSRTGSIGIGTEGGTVKDVVLTTARYGDGDADWDTHKTAMPFLAWQLRESIGFPVDTRVAQVALDSRDLPRTPWVFMTGHRDFHLTPAQAANLRAYLLGGGTLWADDCTHEDDQTWDTAFRREVARVLRPEDGFRLRRITRADNHSLFRACFDLRNGFAGYFPPPGDKFRASYIEAIELNGRLVVIYTRNDYACGLEIQPDTAPLRVSLTGLSPAEMQESSFMMTCNILVYILTRGRGLEDRGLVGRAGTSLVRHEEERRTQRDDYANAPATLFDNFDGEHWRVEDTWDSAGPARLEYARRVEAGAAGRRLTAAYQLPPRKIKIVLSRDLPEELDLSAQDRVYVDLECRFEGGARLSLAVSTLPDWKYFESRPVFLKPGRNRVWFDLRAPTWKTGEQVPEGQTEFCRRIANPDAVRRITFLLYPIQSEGAVSLDRIEFRAKPK